MTSDLLAEHLVPIAARLVGTVRDEGADAVADLLREVPGGRFDALSVVLAAMVDPDRTPRELLAWTVNGLEYHRLVAAGVNSYAAGLLAAGRK